MFTPQFGYMKIAIATEKAMMNPNVNERIFQAVAARQAGL